MWLAVSKSGNGASQLMNDEEKTYWEGTPYGKSWNFIHHPTVEKVELPKGVFSTSEEQSEAPKPKTRKRKRAKKSDDTLKAS